MSLYYFPTEFHESIFLILFNFLLLFEFYFVFYVRVCRNCFHTVQIGELIASSCSICKEILKRICCVAITLCCSCFILSTPVNLSIIVIWYGLVIFSSFYTPVGVLPILISIAIFIPNKKPPNSGTIAISNKILHSETY